MKEKGKRLHAGLQQAERQRQQEVAGDRIGHQGGDRDVQQVVGAGFFRAGRLARANWVMNLPSLLIIQRPFANRSSARIAVKKWRAQLWPGVAAWHLALVYSLSASI